MSAEDGLATPLTENKNQIELYNAVSRRVTALSYLYQYCKQQLKELGLTEYQLMSAAAVAPLDYTADGWEFDEFVAVASRFPPNL